MEQQQIIKEHSLRLEKNTLTVNGVVSVESFDSKLVMANLNNNSIQIKGDNLNVVDLDIKRPNAGNQGQCQQPDIREKARKNFFPQKNIQMNQTLLHPFIAVIFFATGCLSYLIYEFFRSFAKNNIIDALLDIIAAVINSAVFVTVTHFFYCGQLKLHTLISYLTGFVALRFLFAQSIKSFFKRLNEALEKLISFMNKKVQKLQAKFKGVLLKNERGTRKQTTKHGNEPRKQSAKHNKIKKVLNEEFSSEEIQAGELEQLEVLQETYKIATVGMQSIEIIRPMVKDKALKNILFRQYNNYKAFAKEIELQAATQGYDLKPSNILNKAVMYGSTLLNTIADRSTGKLAEIMIQGNKYGHNQFAESNQ